MKLSKQFGGGEHGLIRLMCNYISSSANNNQFLRLSLLLYAIESSTD